VSVSGSTPFQFVNTNGLLTFAEIRTLLAIDLETATSHRNSICEIGIVKNSIVIESKLILG